MTLSQRIAALTGPDRAVDAEVAVAMGYVVCPDQGRWRIYGNGIAKTNKRKLPHFTASLDAAMSVVPEGWFYEAQQGPSGQPHIWNLLTIASGDVRYTRVSGRAPTPALALLAAAMQARGL